jgi:hypothetical protein
MSTELLPCPWCGNPPNDVALGVAYNYVCCHHKDCNVRPAAKYYQEPKDAVAAWNTRATLEPTPLPVIDGVKPGTLPIDVTDTLKALHTQYQFCSDAIIPRSSQEAPTVEQLGMIRDAHLNIISILRELQRLQKIEWCVREQGIDLARRPEPTSPTEEKRNEYRRSLRPTSTQSRTLSPLRALQNRCGAGCLRCVARALRREAEAMTAWRAFWEGFWDGFTLGMVRRSLKRMPVMIFGWRWHFRMSRLGQWLLKVAHRQSTPNWLHDVIERVVYEDRRRG